LTDKIGIESRIHLQN